MVENAENKDAPADLYANLQANVSASFILLAVSLPRLAASWLEPSSPLWTVPAEFQDGAGSSSSKASSQSPAVLDVSTSLPPVPIPTPPSKTNTLTSPLPTVYFILPNWPLTSKMLTPDQRILAHVRILRDRNQHWEPEEAELTPFQAFIAVLKDPKTYFFMLIYSCNILALTISYFIPTMLKGMGYDKVSAQWMTIPIWMCGAAFQIVW